MKKAASKKPVKKVAKKAAKRTSPPIVNPVEQVLGEVNRAVSAGRWLVASFRVENGQMTLDRTALNFPREDIALACRLFVENLELLKAK